jgi:hypothetical protein
MVRIILIRLFYAFLLTSLCEMCMMTSPTYAYSGAHQRPVVTLNIQQGPLGVTLTVKGKNFHAGQASISYIDPRNVPGIFVAPSASSVPVGRNGTFVETTIIMPSSGPAGEWKIVVTDSRQATGIARYHVLVAPGEQNAGIPNVMVNPASGKAGDIIAFTGSNWLPQGTSVTLSLLVGTASSQLLDTPLVSDKNGTITGALHLPTSLDPTQTTATVIASDVTGALHAQTQMILPGPSPTPVPSPSPTVRPTPAVSTIGVANDTGKPPFPPLDTASVILVLLIVGGTLGVAALMLVLFIIPWGEYFHERNMPGDGQW